MAKISMDELQRPDLQAYRQQEKLPCVLVLDNVRSGLNVGSVFRTADAFALEKIALCGITAQPPHREILKTALGSTESVDWQYYATTLEAVHVLKSSGYRILAVEQTTEHIWLQDFEPLPGEKYAFVLGNEVDGVQDEVIGLCEGLIEIPQYGTKHSLNVAVAAGVLTWELLRKYRLSKSI
ncbi:MAG: RNA methyltransferase [Lewinellaceae bacterium]|nr:RNA methyltransferase [Lewinellaceae bacterium]